MTERVARAKTKAGEKRIPLRGMTERKARARARASAKAKASAGEVVED
jgi:hypothetical protein